MRDTRRQLNPVPVVTSLPPVVPEGAKLYLTEEQQRWLQGFMAEQEQQTLDDLPKPTFDWGERKPDLLTPLLYGIGYQVQQPGHGLFTSTTF